MSQEEFLEKYTGLLWLDDLEHDREIERQREEFDYDQQHCPF